MNETKFLTLLVKIKDEFSIRGYAGSFEPEVFNALCDNLNIERVSSERRMEILLEIAKYINSKRLFNAYRIAPKVVSIRQEFMNWEIHELNVLIMRYSSKLPIHKNREKCIKELVEFRLEHKRKDEKYKRVAENMQFGGKEV